MQQLKNICVYCGSSPGVDPAYARAAEALGATLAAEGLGLVFGGGSCGLMGITARATLDGGGHVTGIIPGFLDEREVALQGGAEVHIVPDMHTRKQMMFEKADAFIALPGGIGTLEELAEQLTWIQLGRHQKPLLILDIRGFWRPLLSLFAHMRNEGFVREGYEVRYMVAEHVADAVPMLRAAAQKAHRERQTEGVIERM